MFTEMWITQLPTSIRVMRVNYNESTSTVETASQNMRGVMRETTALLAVEGLMPSGRWIPETTDKAEVSRRFREKQ